MPTQPRKPLWRYKDAIGRDHIGYLDQWYDDGRTYAFRDSTTHELSLVHGQLLKDHAHRIWE